MGERVGEHVDERGLGERAHRFRALGTYVFLATRDPGELPRARRITDRLLADVDRACSRFREDSDLTRANAAAGRWVEVDPLLVAAVRVAVQAARLTDGLVHPLLGRHLISVGYDRDFGLLTDSGRVVPAPAPGARAWERIGIEDESLRVPAGTALDLGATGKGFAADLVATALGEELRSPAIVSVGGDLAVAGPDGSPWPVAVSERPDEVDTVVWLARGGLATSSPGVRRWSRGGTAYHHLIDPRTGSSCDVVWRTASCVGETAVGANTASTAAVILGEQAPAWLEENRVTARLVAADGGVRRLGGWPDDETEVAA